MPIFATDSNRLSTVVKYELAPEQAVCREAVVINAAAATYKVGAVLGKVTATGKYKLVEASANDGSQVAVAVYLCDVNGNAGDLTLAANTDTTVVVMARGPAIVAAGALTFGASVTAGALTTAALAQLKAVGIHAEVTI